MLDTQEVTTPTQVVSDDLKKTYTLNGVTFRPSDHFVMIRAKDGSMKQYLGYAARLAWFRAACPAGLITAEIVEHDLETGFILIKAYVDDGNGHKAEAYGSCSRAGFPGGYVEKAETKAKNRALSDLGFGTLFAQELVEDGADDVADTPQPARQQPRSSTSIPTQAQVEALAKQHYPNRPFERVAKYYLQDQYEEGQELTPDQRRALYNALQAAAASKKSKAS